MLEPRERTFRELTPIADNFPIRYIKRTADIRAHLAYRLATEVRAGLVFGG